MILTTIEEFRAVVPTLASTIEFDEVETFVKTAEVYLQEEILGDELYTFVDTHKAEPDHAKLAEKCKTIIALHATFEGVPFWDLVMEQNGFAIVRTTQLAPASPERVKALRDSTIARRDAVIDYLIDYLEATETYREAWKQSPVYEQLSNCLIRTARELRRYCKWNSSRSAFLELKPKLITDTTIIIEPLVSSVYIAELIQQQRTNSLTTENKKTAEIIKYAMGAYAIDNKPAGDLLINQLVTYMDKNLDKYPTYAQSAEYLTRTTPGYTNSDSKIFVSP